MATFEFRRIDKRRKAFVSLQACMTRLIGELQEFTAFIVTSDADAIGSDEQLGP